MQETRDAGSIPGSGRSPGGGNGNPFQYSCLKNPTGRGELQSVGSQTVGHNWSDLARMHYLKTLNLVWFYFFVFLFGIFLSSSCEIVCLLLKHQKYCVSLLGSSFLLILHSFRACPVAGGLFPSSARSFQARPRLSPTCLSIRTWSNNSCCMWIISQENEKIFLKKKGNWPNIYNC